MSLFCVCSKNVCKKSAWKHLWTKKQIVSNFGHYVNSNCMFYTGSYRIICTARFIMFSVITNIYSKKTKGPILMELFTATGKLKNVF